MIKSAIRYSAIPVGVMLAVCVFTIGLVSVVWMSHARATDGTDSSDRLVTVHDRGRERVLLTNATSVKQALDEAGIILDKNDAVEPALNEELIDKSYFVNIYRARPVIVTDGAVREKIMTPYQTTDKIAQDAGLELHDEDMTELAPTDDIVAEGAGLELKIDRATEFTFVLYGKKATAYTQSETVGDMIKEKKVELGPDDELSVAASTPIAAGMTVELWRNGKQTVTEEQAIDFATEKIQDTAREVNFREVKTPGVKGKKSVTYEIVMQNGREISRKEIQSVVLEQPKKQVEIVGAKPSFSGDFAAALAKLRACESGGNYANKNNPLYRGAYQFSYSTWGNKYGIRDPADASPAQQDQAARELYVRRGWQPWPHCGASLPDTYR